jgi:hypothetical protein
MNFSIKMFVFILILVILSGCSSVNNNSTVTNIPPGKDTGGDSIPVLAYDGSTAIGMMGQYSLSIDPEGSSAQLNPARLSALGQSYIVSGESFFAITPCPDCLKLKNLSLDSDGNLVAGMVIKHPFPKGDPLKPPSGLNRLDLDVFDVALIIAPDELTSNGYPLMGIDTFPGIIINADGYTREMNEVADIDYALPYKICYESEYNNRFEMGTDYEPFDVVFKLSDSLNFDLYLIMGYGASATRPQRLNPVYYVPEFNRKAAWKVVVTPPQGDDPPEPGNTWNSIDTSTEYPVTIDIYDWNHGAVIAAIYPDPTNPDQISAESNIGDVVVEIPGMTLSLVTASTTDTSTNGWDDPLTYTALIANENGLGEGEYYGLVKVIDTRSPGSSMIGGETDTLAHSPNGVLLEWYGIPEFAAYQVFTATVIAGGSGPECDIHADDTDATVGESVTVDPGTSNDPDGSIISYEYDYDYDGSVFDVDIIQNSVDPDFGDPVHFTVCHSSPDIQVVTIALRLTDNDMQTSICTVDITVHPSPKNIALRPGVTAKDIGIQEDSGQGWIGYSDGQIWKYDPDYTSGAFAYQMVSEIKYLDVTSRGDYYCVMTSNMVHFERFDGANNFHLQMFNYETCDVAEIDNERTGYFTYEFGGYVCSLDEGIMGDPTIRNLYGHHEWVQWFAITWSPPHVIPTEAAGQVSFYIMKGIEGGRDYDYLWVLEGAPRFEVERMSFSGAFTGVTIGLDGGQADDMSGFNDPKDITTDQFDYVYVLDLTSTGEPRVKKFDHTGVAIGYFGDSTSISGTPLRIDCDNGDGEIHVLHTNGVSVFRPCEIPD